MANIGTFTKSEQGFTGELVTLSLKAKNVRLVEEAASSNENAPTHRVFVGDRSRLGEALQRGPPVSLGQARRPELHGSHLRQPDRGRGWQDPHADLVSPQRPPQRRLTRTECAPSGRFGRGTSYPANWACAPDGIVTYARLLRQTGAPDAGPFAFEA